MVEGEMKQHIRRFAQDHRRLRPGMQSVRFRYAFVRTYRPVLDYARFRSFESMEAYRKWCEENLPDWLGYGRV